MSSRSADKSPHDARGFTLLEVMVALVLTGIVALLAFATLSTALDGEERVGAHREAAEAHMILRALLLDALRHAPEEGGAAMNEMLLEIDDRVDARGLSVDALRFRSRGVAHPLGASPEWSVELASTAQGLRLLARPGSVSSSAAPVEALLPGVQGLEVRVLARLDEPVWSERWEVPGRFPAAVALAFPTADGQLAAPSLVVRSGWEGVR